MNLDLAALPTDVNALHRLVRDLAAQAADEQTYLNDVLERMTNGYPMSRLDDLLPWNWTQLRAAA